MWNKHSPLFFSSLSIQFNGNMSLSFCFVFFISRGEGTRIFHLERFYIRQILGWTVIWSFTVKHRFLELYCLCVCFVFFLASLWMNWLAPGLQFGPSFLSKHNIMPPLFGGCHHYYYYSTFILSVCLSVYVLCQRLSVCFPCKQISSRRIWWNCSMITFVMTFTALTSTINCNVCQWKGASAFNCFSLSGFYYEFRKKVILWSFFFGQNEFISPSDEEKKEQTYSPTIFLSGWAECETAVVVP